MRISDWSSDVCSSDLYGVKGKFEEFQLRAAELMTSLRDGNIDVAVYSGAATTSAITDLATAKSVRFIPIVEAKAKEVMETHTFFFVDSLKEGTYTGMDSERTTPLTQTKRTRLG